ncbi:MAG TPA: type II toxin-antitoxin system PemK/MazF family toxin [Gammaproteobacteria bacterium]|nr:type II toxin-antitoxin system PemK/MazF family toxin [Gammaproteobacteria bacterium]
MKRGEIWWASLGDPKGSEPGFKRPVVIISSNDFNVSKIKTIIVAVITSNLRLSEAPGNVEISKKSTGLPRNSVINVSQIITIDKLFLTEKIGKLPSKQLQMLNDGVKLVLALF